MKYQKPALDLDKKLNLLVQRGFLVSDEKIISQALQATGYYRLSAYTLPFESGFDENGCRNHNLRNPTPIEDLLDLYEFDRTLRLLVMDAIERIEISLRTRWADALALEVAPHAYLDSNQFLNQIDHAKDIIKIHTDLKDSKEVFIQHYKDHYAEPILPPVWAIVETTTLGQLSRWYKNTKSNTVKTQVMRYFGMPTLEVFSGVLHALTPVRNICAHHGRLWNRKFTFRLPSIKVLQEQLNPHLPDNTTDLLLHNYLVVLNALITNAGLDPAWIKKITSLLRDRPTWQLAQMGFSTGWEANLPWRAS